MKTKNAWTAAGLLCLAIIGLGLFGCIPVFGILSYLILPSAVLLLCAAVINAFVIAFLPMTKRTYFFIGSGVLIFLTWYGVYLRHESDHMGSIDVYSEAKIERPVVAKLREAVLLASTESIYYDRAMFDTILPLSRGDSWVIDGLGWYREPTYIVPKEVLEKIGIEPVRYGDARIKVAITQAERGERTEINAQVIDGGVEVASLKAVLPSPKRQSYSSIPILLRYAIEHNPIVLALASPRKYVDNSFLNNFLTSAIKLSKEETVTVVNVDAAELVSEVISPALKVDRTDPRYLKWWFMSEDERCENILSVKSRSWVGDKYVTFRKSALPAPQLRLGGESLICAGDAVYVHRYGRVPPNILDFSRYNLNGGYTADIHVKLPDNVVTTLTAFDMQSLAEHDGKLSFTARNVRFEWAQDANGKKIRKSDGDLLEYAIIERRVEYEVVLPAASRGLQ